MRELKSVNLLDLSNSMREEREEGTVNSIRKQNPDKKIYWRREGSQI